MQEESVRDPDDELDEDVSIHDFDELVDRDEMPDKYQGFRGE